MALAGLLVVADQTGAQTRPNPAAEAAVRRAHEAEALARKRTLEQGQRAPAVTIDPYEDTAARDQEDPLEGFEDPLDEIDDIDDPETFDDGFGDADTALDSPDAVPDDDAGRVEAPALPEPMDEMDALSGIDDEREREDRDDRRDSVVRELYRSAEEGLGESDGLDGGFDLD